jgi:hypothetical protein
MYYFDNNFQKVRMDKKEDYIREERTRQQKQGGTQARASRLPPQAAKALAARKSKEEYLSEGDTDKQSSGLSGGVIFTIVVLSIVVLLILGFLIFRYLKRRKQKEILPSGLSSEASL